MRELSLFRSIRLGSPGKALGTDQNGQFAAVGTVNGLTIYDTDGNIRLQYPPVSTRYPLVQLEVSPNLDKVIMAAQQGNVVQLNIQKTRGHFNYTEKTLYWSQADLRDVSLSNNGEIIAIGHLSAGVSIVKTSGSIVLERKAENGTALPGRMWLVALDHKGENVFVAGGNMGHSKLLKLHVRNSFENAAELPISGVVSHLNYLHTGDIAIVQRLEYDASKVSVFNPQLDTLMWELETDDPITAIAPSRDGTHIAVAVGYSGLIHHYDMQRDQPAIKPFRSNAVINKLSLSAGHNTSAVTEQGDLLLMRLV